MALAGTIKVTPYDETIGVKTPQAVVKTAQVIDFTAYTNAQHNVTVMWTAELIDPSSTFAILRSSNGKTFTSWRMVSGTQGTQQRIEFLEIDDKPLAKTAWYRLLYINGKGDTTYSEIRVVKTDTRNSTTLEVYPFKETSEPDEHDVLVVMHDTKGEMHFSRAYYKTENGEIKYISLHQELPKGAYVITASSNDELVGSSFDMR
jgi:hypothetical protein